VSRCPWCEALVSLTPPPSTCQAHGCAAHSHDAAPRRRSQRTQLCVQMGGLSVVACVYALILSIIGAPALIPPHGCESYVRVWPGRQRTPDRGRPFNDGQRPSFRGVRAALGTGLTRNWACRAGRVHAVPHPLRTLTAPADAALAADARSLHRHAVELLACGAHGARQPAADGATPAVAGRRSRHAARAAGRLPRPPPLRALSQRGASAGQRPSGLGLCGDAACPGHGGSSVHWGTGPGTAMALTGPGASRALELLELGAGEVFGGSREDAAEDACISGKRPSPSQRGVADDSDSMRAGAHCRSRRTHTIAACVGCAF
jgi:hypothetical protein